MTKHLIATFLSAAVLFTNAARAMEIRQYDKMAKPDQHNYVADLIIGAQKILIDEGRSDLAAQVDKLFTYTPAGDEIPIGYVEFSRNLDRLRLADAENAQKNPKDPRVEVEDAMFDTLHKNHIELPESFFTLMKDFKPKHPTEKKN